MGEPMKQSINSILEKLAPNVAKYRRYVFQLLAELE